MTTLGGTGLVRIVAVLALGLLVARGADAARDEAVEISKAGQGSTDLSELLRGAADAGFERARPGTPLEFPRDHGPRPNFRSGWWYFTGNLKSADGRDFGYQLTFFRIALKPGRADRPSAWASRQIYMAHFAISDIAAGKFYRQQRLARSGLALAGAVGRPFHVWLEDWRVDSVRPGEFLPLVLSARTRTEQGEIALRLELQAGKPRVLQGDRGYSAKSSEPGNASYYYSYTRLPTRGSLRTPAGSFQVQGQSWFDREWSTSALSPEQTGWDWFSLQLEDGRDLMFYRLRLRSGEPDPNNAGILVAANGDSRRIFARDFKLRPLRYWQSPAGRRYPVAWELQYRKLRLEIRPRLDNQAYTRGIPYWEGAIEVSGRDSGTPMAGFGYLEMSGY